MPRSHPQRNPRVRFTWGCGGRAVLIAVVLALCGCTTLDQLMPGKRAAREHAQRLRNVQLSVMRFADEYVGRTREVLNHFQADAQPEDRLHVQNWKVQQATAAYTIASGPNLRRRCRV
jgi:hypothetical protein